MTENLNNDSSSGNDGFVWSHGTPSEVGKPIRVPPTETAKVPKKVEISNASPAEKPDPNKAP